MRNHKIEMIMKKVAFNFPKENELNEIPNLFIECIGECEGLQAKRYKVECFSELVALTAYLRFFNPDYFVLYRGQAKQHYIPNTKKLSFLSTIYRGNPAPDKLEIKKREQNLRDETKRIMNIEAFQNISFPEQLETKKELIAQCIIQHYHSSQIQTPFLDFTQSLRVAYSFANDSNNHEQAVGENVYVYVFGLPYPKANISDSIEPPVTLINFLSICPPTALRPFFQEGYLASINGKYKEIENYDFNKWLIAEIAIPYMNIRDEKFFHRIPKSSLLTNELDPFYNTNFINNTQDQIK